MRLLSGMRPTGVLHIGHLKSVLENWVKYQNEGHQCFYFIADWHALTTDYADTSQIAYYSTEIVKDWIAAGLDPERTVIFLQSAVKEHAELHLLLSMIVPLPWLERNPTYKEQLREQSTRDLYTYGFLGYPVLQAADILIYRAEGVPVGADQVPHIELTREIARRFNNFYGETFPEPRQLLMPVPKIPGTDGRKMSKSYNNAIFLTDPPEEIRQKILTMKTDTRRKRRTDPGVPEDCPVYYLHLVYSTDEEIKSVKEGCTTAGIGCVDCKRILLNHLIPEMEELQRKRATIDDSEVMDVLIEGAKKAREIAAQTMEDVRGKIGLLGLGK